MRRWAGPLVAGAAALAVAGLGTATPWPRSLALGLVVAAAVVLAGRIPIAGPAPDLDLDAEPESTGYHPATLLADAFARAASDPGGLRRVRPRLRALAQDLLALRGASVEQAVASGLLTARTAAFLDLAPGPAEPTGRTAEALRRAVAELVELTPADLSSPHLEPSAPQAPRSPQAPR